MKKFHIPETLSQCGIQIDHPARRMRIKCQWKENNYQLKRRQNVMMLPNDSLMVLQFINLCDVPRLNLFPNETFEVTITSLVNFLHIMQVFEQGKRVIYIRINVELVQFTRITMTTLNVSFFVCRISLRTGKSKRRFQASGHPALINSHRPASLGIMEA